MHVSTASNHEIQKVFNHEAAKPQNTSIIKLASNFNNQLQIPKEHNEIELNENPATKKAKRSRKIFVKNVLENYEKTWKEDIRAGRLSWTKNIQMHKEYIDAQGSFRWLNARILQYDSERIMLAAQDQGKTTRATLPVFDRSTEPNCRFCRHDSESPSHLPLLCETLKTQGQYNTRRNKLCSNIHWNILGTFNIDRSEKYWEHEPQRFIKTKEIDIYYDKPVQLGASIDNRANRPDIIIHNKTTKQVQIVEESITIH